MTTHSNAQVFHGQVPHNQVQRAVARAILALVTSLVSATAAMATEGGGYSYPVGVDTFYSGMMLPEGLNLLLYYSHYQASTSKDNAGNDNSKFAYYKIRSDTVSLRASYVWPGVQWLGANVETRAALPLTSLNLSLGIARRSPLTPLDKSGDKTAQGDMSFIPIILGWHGEKFHQLTGIETYLPVGDYNVSDPVNTGRNYYQVAPFYAATWIPSPSIDLNTKIRYGINSRNKDTNYRSGNEFTLEFGGGYHFSQAITLGVNGFLYRQTTDDVQNDAAVNGNGNRGRVNAIGPYIAASLTQKISLIAKVQSEFNAVNRSQGTRVWLQMKVPL
jgi:hypothetical protein